MRVMWHGINGQYKTGYANQTALFTPAIEDAGHVVAINSAIYQYNTAIDQNGIVNYATGPGATMGNRMLLSHYSMFKADCLISMLDTFICQPDVFEKTNWYPFVMIDSEPMTPDVRESLKVCSRPIACSRHGLRLLHDAGYDAFYCPLAIDTQAFHPVDRSSARTEIGKVIGRELAPETYFVVMNSANMSRPSRKNFAAAFSAWAAFEAEHPSALLYVHTDITGTMFKDGENLLEVAALYGCKNITFAPQYDYWSCVIPDTWMNLLYNAADLFLHTARGEGFGLPIVEAQAAGCPVVVPNFGAMAENCKRGMTCEGRMWMHYPGAEQILVDVDEVVSALEWSFVNRMRDNGAIAITADRVQEFDIRNVMEKYMKPILTEIESEIKQERRNEKREVAGQTDVSAFAHTST